MNEPEADWAQVYEAVMELHDGEKIDVLYRLEDHHIARFVPAPAGATITRRRRDWFEGQS